MGEYVVPIVCAVIGFAGAVYAVVGRRASDKADLADRLWDQVQEGDRTLQEERRRHAARELVWTDYVIRLRWQVQEHGGVPAPYPDELTRSSTERNHP